MVCVFPNMFSHLVWITLPTICLGYTLNLEPDDKDIIISAGGSLKLTCTGDTPLEWYYPSYNGVSIQKDKSTKSVFKTQDDKLYKAELELTNAYFMDTGFYICHPLDEPEYLQSLMTYVYVKDDKHLLAVNNSMGWLQEHHYKNLTIPCRPTSPDVNVTLFKDDEPLVLGSKDKGWSGFLDYSPMSGFFLTMVNEYAAGNYDCKASKGKLTENVTYAIFILPHTEAVNKPYINTKGANHVMIGQNAYLDCSLSTELGVIVTLDWVLPNPARLASGNVHILKTSTERGKHNHIIEHKVLEIVNATLEDSGLYICNVTDSSHNFNQAEHRLVIYTREESYLNLTLSGKSNKYQAKASERQVFWIVKITSHPKVTTVRWFFRQGKKQAVQLEKGEKYKMATSRNENEIKLTINQLNINDSGIYQLYVSNENVEEKLELELLVEGNPSMESLKPKADDGGYSEGKMFFMENKDHTISCVVVAYPMPTVTWYFQVFENYPNVSEQWHLLPTEDYVTEIVDSVRLESQVMISATASGILHCKACNVFSCHIESIDFLVTDVERGFDLWGSQYLVAGDNASLYCGASIYDFSPELNWLYFDPHQQKFVIINETDRFKVTTGKTKFSYQTKLEIKNVTQEMAGKYKCDSRLIQAGENEEPIVANITVVAAQYPKFLNGTSLRNTTKSVSKKDSFLWNCFVSGAPTPQIYWFKDGALITNEKDHRSKKKSVVTLLNGNRTLSFEKVDMSDEGVYTCKAENRLGTIISSNKLRIDPDMAGANGNFFYLWMTIFGILIFSFAVVIAFLICRVKRERELRKELTKSVLETFDEGAEGSINPELSVVEQADLLPYKQKFEFPRDKLKLGKQLGSGAFGVVLKGEAEGILEEDVATTVAVKMLKQNVDVSHFKALTTELKIMIHLGQHLNVVNLLGACTRNLNNRELLVIVEYCRYGNLHNYLQRHRDTFINQVNAQTGTFDPTIISSASSPKMPKYLNLSFRNGTVHSNGRLGSASEGRLGSTSDGRLGSTSDGRLGSVSDDRQPNTTDMTSLSVSSSTPIGEDGYLICREPPPEWSQQRADQPICTQDLFCWSFQVARGMEYLAGRKILHGDLAARNILLADNNIVKICDFGLSKNMYSYKNDNYFKKGKRLLPVKWMALEAIRDRNFSIQSDIWAYGIVMWELFSLARTPYPGLEDVEKLYHKLEQGYRMEKPEFATNSVYEVMVACWNARPMLRPSFTDLAERLGNMLEDSVRKHYVDLNDPFLKQNAEFLSQQDYLSMLKAPEYANLNGATEDSPGTSGYMSMRRKTNREQAQEETELRPMLGGAGVVGGSSVSDTDSVPNSPSATATGPGGNFVTVAEATESCGFSNPTYHNLGRPPINPYMNTPYIIEKEGKPFGQQWNTSSTAE